MSRRRFFFSNSRRGTGGRSDARRRAEFRDETAGHHVDFAGLVTVTGGLVAFVLGIQQGDTLGWGSPFVLGALGLAVLLLAAFFVIERRIDDPLIELGLFRSRDFLGANAVGFVVNYGFGAVVLHDALPPEHSELLPVTDRTGFLGVHRAAGGVGGADERRLDPAWRPDLDGRRYGVIAVAFLLLTLITPAGELPIILVALVLAGTGIGVAYTLSNTVGMGALPDAKGGEASGVLGMVRLLGAVRGRGDRRAVRNA